MLIIISKLDKTSYDTSKSLQPIVLLNIVGKLIKNVISNRIQVHSIASNFIHLNQIDDIKKWSTMDTGIFLTYLICIG